MAPNLSRIAESFVRIPSGEPDRGLHLGVLRDVVIPRLLAARDAGLVGWYSFLVHSTENGVPPELGSGHPYWHVRIEMQSGVGLDEIVAALGSDFLGTRPADQAILEAMSFPSAELLAGGVVDAWHLLGEQSEWLVAVMQRYPGVSPRDFAPGLSQLLHYFANMTQMEVRLR